MKFYWTKKSGLKQTKTLLLSVSIIRSLDSKLADRNEKKKSHREAFFGRIDSIWFGFLCKNPNNRLA